MAFTYENVIPPLIENTIMQKRLRDGIDYQYTIRPAEGYVLHDNAMDYPLFDDNGDLTGEIVQIFTEGTCSCAANYDFATNPREFFTRPISEVPSENIHGGGDSDHEIM